VGEYEDRRYSGIDYPSQSEISRSYLSSSTPLYQNAYGLSRSVTLSDRNKHDERRTSAEYRQNFATIAHKREMDMEEQQQDQYPKDQPHQRRLSNGSDRGQQEGVNRDILSHKRPYAPTTISDIHLNDIIKFSRPGGKISKGVVRYIGSLPGKNDQYLGLELEDEESKHDGVYQGQRLFQCKTNKGVFVGFSKVIMAWGSR
ncbi:unnamed protein product, partial [Didymodactylos carnosus]